MLKLYVTDNDLKKYHPNLSKQLWSGQNNYKNQIDEAFSRVLVDVENKGINPRLMMTPFKLNTSTTIATGALTGSSFDYDKNVKRFVVDVNVLAGAYVFKLQGSSDDSNWKDISTLSATTVATKTEVFDESYRYYRYVLSVTTAGSISFDTYLLETINDKLVVYKSFCIINSDFRKSQNDTYDMLYMQYEQAYNTLLETSRFYYDADDSGTIGTGEDISAQPIFYI